MYVQREGQMDLGLYPVMSKFDNSYRILMIQVIKYDLLYQSYLYIKNYMN